MLFSENVASLVNKSQISPPAIQGVLTRVVGLTLEASGIHAPIGAHCDFFVFCSSRNYKNSIPFGTGTESRCESNGTHLRP